MCTANDTTKSPKFPSITTSTTSAAIHATAVPTGVSGRFNVKPCLDWNSNSVYPPWRLLQQGKGVRYRCLRLWLVLRRRVFALFASSWLFLPASAGRAIPDAAGLRSARRARLSTCDCGLSTIDSPNPQSQVPNP
jgi:hypothetical protein